MKDKWKNQFERLEYETEPDTFEQDMDIYNQHCSNCTFCIFARNKEDSNRIDKLCCNRESECFDHTPEEEWCWAWKQRTKAQLHWDRVEEDLRRRMGDE